jgi:hypothetical protein
LASKSFVNLKNERIMPMLDEIIKQYDGRTQTSNYSVIDNPTADNVHQVNFNIINFLPHDEILICSILLIFIAGGTFSIMHATFIPKPL